MTFEELVAEVYLITNRPDLEGETKSAVRAATLKAHQSDFYSKDLFETGVEFPSSDYKQSLDYITLVSNYRSLKYLRRVEDENDDVGAFFDIIAPEESLDSYGINRSDIAYVAGRVLEIRSKVAFSKALFSCYVNPIVREGAYSSWVADQFPYAIIHESARRIFAAVGQMEESNGQLRLVAEEFNLLRQQSLSDVGY